MHEVQDVLNSFSFVVRPAPPFSGLQPVLHYLRAGTTTLRQKLMEEHKWKVVPTYAVLPADIQVVLVFQDCMRYALPVSSGCQWSYPARMEVW